MIRFGSAQRKVTYYMLHIRYDLACMAKNFEELRKKMSPEAQARSKALADKEAEAALRSLAALEGTPQPDKPTTDN